MFHPVTTVDLTKVRLGRTSLTALRARIRTETLTPADCDRLLGRIEQAFEELGPVIDESPDPTRTVFTASAERAHG